MPLAKIVKTFLSIEDEEYFDDKIDVLNLSDKQNKKYCTKDVAYLGLGIATLQEFFNEEFPNDLALTLPSMSFKTFEDYFIPEGSEFLHDSRRNDEFFNDNYYFGGHTEKFITGQKVFRGIRYYDVNSLYPFIMKYLRINYFKMNRQQPNIKTLKKLIKQDRTFYAEIRINVNSEELRFFPVFIEKEGFNSYPLGSRVYKVSEVGIKFILKYGGWENIEDVYTILAEDENIKTITPFKDFVETFYKIRKHSRAYDVIAKLILNSLYGKFGQRTERKEKIINSIEEDYIAFKKLNDECTVSTFKKETPFYQLYRNRLDIAGKITESARLYMGEIINETRKHGTVIYTDTDSLMTYVDIQDIPELKHLLDDKELGKLSDEIGYKDSAIILGLKMYHFYKSGKKATKGVRKMNLQDFKDVVRGKTQFYNERFSKFNMLVNKGFFGIQTVPFNIQNITERVDMITKKQEVKRKFKRTNELDL